jgi:hypothetical protein
LKSVFKKGFVYKLSSCPSVVFYIAEHTGWGKKKDKTYEGEALGRRLAIVFCEDAREGNVKRVHRDNLGVQQRLLTLADLLQTIGGATLLPDPERTAATTALLLEIQFQDTKMLRSDCTLEPAAPDVHMYALEKGVVAEAAFALE